MKLINSEDERKGYLMEDSMSSYTYSPDDFEGFWVISNGDVVGCIQNITVTNCTFSGTCYELDYDIMDED